MLHASALAIGWRSALFALAEAHSRAPRAGSDAGDSSAAPSGPDDGDEDREPFHLDDTELALRLARDRGLVSYRTPAQSIPAIPSSQHS